MRSDTFGIGSLRAILYHRPLTLPTAYCARNEFIRSLLEAY